MFRMLICLCVALGAACAVLAVGEHPAPPKEAKTVRLLTVGNSFADNATRFLPEIVKAAGHRLVLCRANGPGFSFKNHWALVEAYQADPQGAKGKYYHYPPSKESYSLQELLALEAWDVITIQQVSWLSPDSKSYQPCAKNLYDYLRQHAPQAEVVIHQTWAYRSDDPQFKDPQKNSSAQMYQQSRANYHALAKELGGLRIFPVGDAFHRVDTDPAWGFQPDTTYDFANPVYPKLPAQAHALHTGWYWNRDSKTGKTSLGYDGHHANMAGEYLGACVWFECLYGESVVDNTFVPKGMPPDEAAHLRMAAHQAVEALRAEAK